MEQKTFLAIILSFLFLIAYNSLVISPQQKSKQEIQTLDVKYTGSNNSNTTSPNENDLTKAQADISEEIKNVQIGAFKIFFGEHTGNIKKIYNDFLNYSPILTNFFVLNNNQKLKNYVQDKDKITFIYEYMNISWEVVLQAIDKNKLTSIINFITRPSDNFSVNLFDIDASRVINNAEIMRESMLFEYSHLIDNKVIRKGNAFKFTPKDTKKESVNIEWFGWRDRYHFNIVKPLFRCSDVSTNYLSTNQLGIQLNNCKHDSQDKYSFEIFLGPQDLKLLNSLGGNLSKIMAFSGNPILDFIEKLIYELLLFLNNYINNWGLSIILISIFIYGITYPLTFKSMMSMKKMQELQPKMAELREKYKSDPQKLNTEVVQLYKTHNINPLGGCLPMLLQMPVFISLYQVLWRTHDFQNASFLWIKDLSMPDRAFILNMNIPFIGNELNILPIIMAAVMFAQQKLSLKNNVGTDPAQAMQQKMMVWIFPIFIGGIFYHFASGLTLYFTVFYLLSTLMQFKMSKLK